MGGCAPRARAAGTGGESGLHRPTSGLGFSANAEAAIRAGRKLESLVKLWDVAPASDLLRAREENEAYLTARPGLAYALYFPDGGAVDLDLRGSSNRFTMRWIDIATGEWGPQQSLQGGGWTAITAPANGHWAAAIVSAAISQ